MTDASLAHGQRREAAQPHELLEDDGAGHDDVGALGLEAGDPAAAAQRQGRKAQAEGAHLRAVEREAVDRRSTAVARPEVHAGERAHGAPQRDQPAGRARRHAQGLKLIARVTAEGRDLGFDGRIVAQKPAGDAHRAQRQARHGHDLSATDGRELQATAAQVRDHCVADGEAAQRRDGAEARLFLPPEHLDLDARDPPQAVDQAMGIGRVPHCRGGGGDDAQRPAVVDARNEATDGGDGGRHASHRQRAATAGRQARLHPRLVEEPERPPGDHASECEPHSVGAEIDQYHALHHARSIETPAPAVKLRDRYDPQKQRASHPSQRFESG